MKQGSAHEILAITVNVLKFGTLFTYFQIKCGFSGLEYACQNSMAGICLSE